MILMEFLKMDNNINFEKEAVLEMLESANELSLIIFDYIRDMNLYKLRDELCSLELVLEDIINHLDDNEEREYIKYQEEIEANITDYRNRVL